MKITKLVILFNKNKILIGLGISIVSILISFLVSEPLSLPLLLVSVLIIINIFAAIIASYIPYDKSELFYPEKLFKNINFTKKDRAILLHASFDPVSNKLEKLFEEGNLTVYNIYGNRHEEETAIKISERYFPPNEKEIKIDPTNFPEENDSYNYLFAITSIHEIITHEKRVQFFKEAKRILKNDGTLIVCEQMRSWVNFLCFNFGVLHFVSMKNWILAITEAGMKIDSKKSLTPFAKVLYIKK